jgi:C-methyltransferase C-terminal domain
MLKKKSGILMPGIRLPIKSPDAIDELKLDYVLILPWNIKEEIISQLSQIRCGGGKFIVPIPRAEVLN